jgi:perosamine synthetase
VSTKWIPISKPSFLGNERRYVDECMETVWISSIGRFITEFENAFAEYVGARHAIACNNGTTALHAALLGAGVRPGDKVLVPSLTYVASANAILYCGAEPVFVDSDPHTWNVDPDDFEHKAVGAQAALPVHLYGKSCAMDRILDSCKRHGLALVEDAAEAFGVRLNGRHVGTFGKVGTFSFFGNKVLTTGEGGMVVTDDEAVARRIRQVKGQGQDPDRRYWFPIVGYNYRMTNIQAAIGLGQLETIDRHLEERMRIANRYRSLLSGVEGLRLPALDAPGEQSVCWVYSVILEGASRERRDRVMTQLRRDGIETRPFFFATHHQPPYGRWAATAACPVAEELAQSGLSLPTWIGLPDEDVKRVSEALITALALPG